MDPIERKYLTWSDIFNAVSNLLDNLHNKEINHIIGIGNGGLIPATIVANKLKKSLKVQNFGISSYISDNLQSDFRIHQLPEIIDYKNVLIIDDINDSGNTFTAVNKIMDSIKANNVIYGSLFYREGSNFKNCFYGKKITRSDGWLVMPWE